MKDDSTPDLFDDGAGKRLADLLAQLPALDRRIENMRHLLAYKEEERRRVVEGIRHIIGRREARTAFIDFDARRDPRTDRWCVMCQRDIAEGAAAATVRLTLIDGARPHAVHRDDAGLADAGVLTIPGEDQGTATIGLDCARRLGHEWTSDAKTARRARRG